MDSENTLRRSKRTIKKKQPLSATFLSDSCAPKPWTKLEKTQLLEALEVCEDNDIKSISKFIPTRTSQQIDYYIRSIKRKARMISNKNTMIPELEKWEKILSKVTKDFDVSAFDQITVPLFMVSLFESFPNPAFCDGIDFKAAYEFIFCIMAEIPPRELNSKTFEFISKTFNEMESMVNGNEDLKHHVMAKLKEAANCDQTINPLNPLNFPELSVPILPANECEE